MDMNWGPMKWKSGAAHVFNQVRLNNNERVLVGLKHNISNFTYVKC